MVNITITTGEEVTAEQADQLLMLLAIIQRQLLLSMNLSAPKPKIDEKQVEANQHYKEANKLYNNEDYKGTIKELEKIYDLGKNNNQTEILIKNSLLAIYQLAGDATDQKDYTTAKSYLSYIKENKHSSTLINQKVDVLLNQIMTHEKVESKLDDATTARDNKEYKKTFELVKEAQKISNVEKTRTFYNDTVKALAEDADMAYHNKQYKQANTYYALLINNTSSGKLKTKYKMLQQQMKDEQLLQKSFYINSKDLAGDTLYTHIMDEKNETPFKEGVVTEIKSSLVEGVKETMHFIYKINIKELFNGGKQDAA